MAGRMNAPPSNGLSGPCVILNEPQLAENIGAVARVMANFGLSDLRLVRPRGGWPQDRARASAAYEWRLTRADGPPPGFTAAPPPADQAMVHGFYDQLEAELEAAGFFHPPEKRASMVRNLRVAFGRASLSEQEVRTLRGVVT